VWLRTLLINLFSFRVCVILFIPRAMTHVQMRPSVPCLLLAQFLSIITICEAIDWTAGSVLGLQRGFKIKKGGAMPPAIAEVGADATLAGELEVDYNTGSLLGLQRGFTVKKGGAVPPATAEVGATATLLGEPEVEYSTASLLGLQRGSRLVRRSSKLQDAEEIEDASGLPAEIGVGSIASGSHKLQQGAQRRGSVLGLQRGFQVQKAALAASIADEDAESDWIAGSLLGLQRGFQIHKNTKLTEDPGEGNSLPVSQDEVEAAEQQPLDWPAASLLGLQRRVQIHKKGARPQEAAEDGASLVRSEPAAAPSAWR